MELMWFLLDDSGYRNVNLQMKFCHMH